MFGSLHSSVPPKQPPEHVEAANQPTSGRGNWKATLLAVLTQRNAVQEHVVEHVALLFWQHWPQANDDLEYSPSLRFDFPVKGQGLRICVFAAWVSAQGAQAVLSLAAIISVITGAVNHDFAEVVQAVPFRDKRCFHRQPFGIRGLNDFIAGFGVASYRVGDVTPQATVVGPEARKFDSGLAAAIIADTRRSLDQFACHGFSRERKNGGVNRGKTVDYSGLYGVILLLIVKVRLENEFGLCSLLVIIPVAAASVKTGKFALGYR